MSPTLLRDCICRGRYRGGVVHNGYNRRSFAPTRYTVHVNVKLPDRRVGTLCTSGFKIVLMFNSGQAIRKNEKCHQLRDACTIEWVLSVCSTTNGTSRLWNTCWLCPHVFGFCWPPKLNTQLDGRWQFCGLIKETAPPGNDCF